ncbi:hypothetical protein B0H13DRAFT_1476016, partial [Mycena leptocephala]
FTLGLFAALTVQLYLYYQAFPNDMLVTKCLVHTIYILEFVQTAILTQAAFATFGDGFGDVASLTDQHLVGLTFPIMGGLVASAGQWFYAYRVHVLSRGWIIPGLI